MTKRKRYDKQVPGPNPDPEKYMLVRTKEGCYYRLKRGLKKPAMLNATLQQNADATKVCSPAAKRIALILRDHLRGLDTGRLIAHLTGLLKKSFHEKRIADFSFFGDYDFQRDHPLDELLKAHYQCREKDGVLQLQISIVKEGVKRHSSLVSEYYFDLVLLYGDATKEDGLRVESVTSPLYSYLLNEESTCTLSLPLPQREEPWIAMLKINSQEGNELAHHPRHYGMKVVKLGH